MTLLLVMFLLEQDKSPLLDSKYSPLERVPFLASFHANATFPCVSLISSHTFIPKLVNFWYFSKEWFPLQVCMFSSSFLPWQVFVTRSWEQGITHRIRAQRREVSGGPERQSKRGVTVRKCYLNFRLITCLHCNTLINAKSIPPFFLIHKKSCFCY